MTGSRIAQRRFQDRLLRHHLPLFAGSAISIAALYCTRPYSDWVMRASFSTAYPALVLLVATLLLGPWKVLRRHRNPVSSDLRRDVGIWAAIVGILHSVIGQNVHFRGRPWFYYIYSPPEHHHFPLRHDLFGFANYTGLLGFLVLVTLAATSNDLSLRALGTGRWKQIQRWNYVLFALVAVHGVGYLIIEKQKVQFVTTVAVCLGVALLLQAAGYAARRSQPDRRKQQDSAATKV